MIPGHFGNQLGKYVIVSSTPITDKRASRGGHAGQFVVKAQPDSLSLFFDDHYIQGQLSLLARDLI